MSIFLSYSIQDSLRLCRVLGVVLAACQPGQQSESSVIYSPKAGPCPRALPAQPPPLLLPLLREMFCLCQPPLTLPHNKALPVQVSTSSFPVFHLLCPAQLPPSMPGGSAGTGHAVWLWLLTSLLLVLISQEQSRVRVAVAETNTCEEAYCISLTLYVLESVAETLLRADRS